MCPRALITAPTAEPFDLDAAKSHLRVTDDGEDTLITSLITAAREHAEAFTERAFVEQTWETYYDSFPACIELPLPNLISVESIKYLDTNGDEQTVTASDYVVDDKRKPGRIFLAQNASWPSTYDQVNAVTVQFKAGYGDDTAVPETIKAAIKLILGHLFEHREDVAEFSMEQIPMGAKSLLSPHIIPEAA